MSSRAAEVAAQAGVREIRRRWLLSAPALLIVFFAAAGPLLVVLLYSFMVKGDYGDVKYWQFSLDGWLLRRGLIPRRLIPLAVNAQGARQG